MIATCVVWFCLIAEGHANRCARPSADDEIYSRFERVIDHAATSGLRPERFTTIEYRACERIAREEIATPVNHRRVTFFVERKGQP